MFVAVVIQEREKTMRKLIKNNWNRIPGKSFDKIEILNHQIHPEGLDIYRLRFFEPGSFAPDAKVGHIVSVLRGGGGLHVSGDDRSPFRLTTGMHLYLPSGTECALNGQPGTELLCVSSASASQARGKKLLLRDETFLAACASEGQSLRWTFTPQYLSRRVFLHHDPILVSKSGNPVSWFRTTMFDVAGLPINESGEPVFKMSYNSRTECNVCYDVKGDARVRMAQHPYTKSEQPWSPWYKLDDESTYHLNEAAGSPEEESFVDDATRTMQFLRNKHEVFIADGHVTLCCLFDPAPTGIERHRPGEYSDYEPLSQVLGTKPYEIHQREIAKYDEMVDMLSIAKATSTLNSYHGTPIWQLYEEGRKAQADIENEIANALAAEGKGRERVLAYWMQSRT